MRYELISVDGRKIASTLISSDTALLLKVSAESQIMADGKVRGGCIQSEAGKIFAFSNDPDYIKIGLTHKPWKQTDCAVPGAGSPITSLV